MSSDNKKNEMLHFNIFIACFERSKMKKKIAIVTFVLTMLCAVTAFAAATFSDAWRQGADGVWRVYNAQGILQKSVWFCDDAVGGPSASDNWYLLDKNGSMVSAPIVKDGTGNYYSLEINHNGYYGMIRHTTGTYDGIYIIFSQNHDGTFGAIQNPDAINALIAKYGLFDISNINNSNCVYSSKILGKSSPTPTPTPTPATNEYTVKYYVDGSYYDSSRSSSPSIRIRDYGSRLLYWEDRNNGDIYYPGQYASFRGSRHTITLDAVLEERQTYTLTYYSMNNYWDQQTSGNGKFSVLPDPWTNIPDMAFIAWEDSRGNHWNHGETYTARSYNDKLTAIWNPFVNDSGNDGYDGSDDYYAY